MQVEIDVLEANHTWQLVDLLTGKKPIGSRWIYKIKCHADGSVEKYKARLVVKGYNQLDVNNVFLHDFLDEQIYMQVPNGYPGQVCKLTRSLYELKQTSRQWNKKFTMQLANYGFKQSYHDNCLLVLKDETRFMVLVVYVDDILLAKAFLEEIKAVKAYLHDKFTIKNIGEPKYFLGIQIVKSEVDWQAYDPNSPLMEDPSDLTLQAYCDADWARCKITRRSITGHSIMLGTSLIS
ncbi:transmembrane signal receptor [Lithospermum erythrorhizon]|uniref:Transmembrane signal receptor n=1 Tax=Lithospermum erythrorhizon TaxID=34254 RepID=A0AAV3NQT8_LITER